jgi:hypothetical protein
MVMNVTDKLALEQSEWLLVRIANLMNSSNR